MNKERNDYCRQLEMNKTVAEALTLVNNLKLELAGVKEVTRRCRHSGAGIVSRSSGLEPPAGRAKHERAEFRGLPAKNFCRAGMLKEFSLRYCHSRAIPNAPVSKESDFDRGKKGGGVPGRVAKPLVCVGETLAEREGGPDGTGFGNAGGRRLAGLTKEQMLKPSLPTNRSGPSARAKTATTQQAQDAHGTSARCW